MKSPWSVTSTLKCKLHSELLTMIKFSNTSISWRQWNTNSEKNESTSCPDKSNTTCTNWWEIKLIAFLKFLSQEWSCMEIRYYESTYESQYEQERRYQRLPTGTVRIYILSPLTTATHKLIQCILHRLFLEL